MRNTSHEFQRAGRARHIRIWCESWSDSVWQIDDVLLLLGYSSDGFETSTIRGPEVSSISAVFGDTTSVLGALDADGKVHTLEEYRSSAARCWVLVSQEVELRVSHLAFLDNGQCCVSTRAHITNDSHSTRTPCDAANLNAFEGGIRSGKGMEPACALHVFKNFDELIIGSPPLHVFDMREPVIQLLGSASTFVALTSPGEVLTFGSALHTQGLGRVPSHETPACQPGPLTFLGGIVIRKIATCGWIGAALSYDNDLYIWGAQVGTKPRIQALPNSLDDERVRLVDVDDGVDITDVGIGENHLIVLTAKGEVWTSGSNRYGQLGIGSTADFESQWVRVDLGELEGRQVTQVGAGFWSSWFLLEVER